VLGLLQAVRSALAEVLHEAGQGALLREHLKTCMGFEQTAESGFSARRRHVQALQQAAGHLDHGHAQLTLAGAGELLAEDLRQAQQALGEITGAFSSDDLLGRIFSSFCIGK
jgi:tRNA modification GTPase